MYLSIFGLNPPWACPLRTLPLDNTKNTHPDFSAKNKHFFINFFEQILRYGGCQKRWKYKVFWSSSSLSFSDTDYKFEFQVHFVSPDTNHKNHHQITKHKILSSLPLPPNFPHQSPHLSDQNNHYFQSPTYPQFWKSPRTSHYRSHLHSQKIFKFAKFSHRCGGNKNSGKPQGPTASVISFWYHNNVILSF